MVQGWCFGDNFSPSPICSLGEGVWGWGDFPGARLAMACFARRPGSVSRANKGGVCIL